MFWVAFVIEHSYTVSINITEYTPAISVKSMKVS